ncbi:MAG: DUF615 domain-containing protein [Neisseriaceae bacterium]|nr:MAG: DUF615 domain-containing protein [Neisseriaceae bacterium]
MLHDSQQEKIVLSKTKIKQEMNALQALGKRLTTLSIAERRKLSIPDFLEEAIQDYSKIKSNGAKRRQLQFIGRLMKELSQGNVQVITTYFSILDGNNQSYNAYIKRLEITRNALISNEGTLTEFLYQHPNVESSYLRTLIRNCKKESSDHKPSRAYREIFKLLREVEPFDYQS